LVAEHFVLGLQELVLLLILPRLGKLELAPELVVVAGHFLDRLALLLDCELRRVGECLALLLEHTVLALQLEQLLVCQAREHRWMERRACTRIASRENSPAPCSP
jgi:hypothetical protein